jgi:1-deoxy-D-xylulose-5-phosphate reductoisomerase
LEFGGGILSTRRISILGSTGSVGTSTLDILGHARAGGQSVELVALTANDNVQALAEQALAWRPKVAVVANPQRYDELKARLAGSGVEVAAGEDEVEAAAKRTADWVMSSIVGVAGLKPTLAAARTGATIALANKESIVCAGPLLLTEIKKAGGQLIPVDSEHSAIFQSLGGLAADHAAKLILTSSGGPFRTWTRQAMSGVTPAQAVAHPNFAMGAKISVDSAQMMNKGLEIIEAAYLFDTPEERIEVLVHPQQIIHSMVELVDGSSIAQLGPPDMRGPIACAWAWPDRMRWPAPALDLIALQSLTFYAPDPELFPALRLAREALQIGGGAPAALNAANEVAVAAFLAGQIGFLEIAAIVGETLETMGRSGELKSIDSLGAAFAAHARANAVATDLVDGARRPRGGRAAGA